MTRTQTTVMWMGLGLILVRLFTTGEWTSIWTDTILKGQAPGGPGSSGGQIPPFLTPGPAPGIPKFNIPTPYGTIPLTQQQIQQAQNPSLNPTVNS